MPDEPKKRGPGNPAFSKGMKSLNPKGRPKGSKDSPHCKRQQRKIRDTFWAAIMKAAKDGWGSFPNFVRAWMEGKVETEQAGLLMEQLLHKAIPHSVDPDAKEIALAEAHAEQEGASGPQINVIQAMPLDYDARNPEAVIEIEAEPVKELPERDRPEPVEAPAEPPKELGYEDL